MTWNPDAPLEMLDRAARIYIELCGHAAFCNWLEQELPRVKIYLNYKEAVVFMASTASGASQPQPPKPPLAATSAASPIVEEMVEALRWYADGENYRAIPGGSRQRVLMDDGSRASAVLAKYDEGKF